MSARSRSRGAQVVRVLLCGLAVAHLLEALALRRRRHQLAALPEPTSAEGGGQNELDVVAVARTEVDQATLAAAAREMQQTGADVVDLVPANLPAARALQLLRRVDPERLGTDPFYTPGGAHEALAIRASVAERLAQRPDGASPASADLSGPAAMVRPTTLAQRYAPTRTAMRVAPALRARRTTPDERWYELEEMNASTRLHVHLAVGLHGLETAHLLAMTAGLAVAPVAAAAALATWTIQPLLVLGSPTPSPGTPPTPGALRPPDLGRASLLRLVSAWRDNVRTAAAGFRASRRAAAERLSAPIHRPPPAEERFDDQRDTCPWCGSPELTGVVDLPDIAWHKPGWFHMDECAGCGHVFQNPPLSPAGLDYYYDQIYDGPADEMAELAFVAQARAYQRRAEAVGRVTRPRAWLDVGTGRAHFCLVARQEWPEAVFDGLDMGESVEEAERRGWVDTAYRGMFPELADGLPRSYDVVSMFHYLEHTRDPRREITAALKVLEPGGHLVIEVPDPECLWRHRLGAYWFSWAQPQHLHFVPCGNLVTALEEAGFEVVSVERAAANMGGDVSWAVLLAAERLAPSPYLPWDPSSTILGRVRRFAVCVAAIPPFAAAQVVDRVETMLLARPGATRPSNCYRVVARRR